MKKIMVSVLLLTAGFSVYAMEDFMKESRARQERMRKEAQERLKGSRARQERMLEEGRARRENKEMDPEMQTPREEEEDFDFSESLQEGFKEAQENFDRVHRECNEEFERRMKEIGEKDRAMSDALNVISLKDPKFKEKMEAFRKEFGLEQDEL